MAPRPSSKEGTKAPDAPSPQHFVSSAADVKGKRSGLLQAASGARPKEPSEPPETDAAVRRRVLFSLGLCVVVLAVAFGVIMALAADMSL